MLIKYKNDNTVLTNWQYDEENKLFKISNGDEEVQYEYISKLNLDNGYDISNFKIEILHNKRKDYAENDIYQVYVLGKRVGWIFPIQALLSSDHDQATNRFFLKYAYVATCLLINQIESDQILELPGAFELEDYYDYMDSVLVLDLENCEKIELFQIENYVVDLFRKGYSFSGIGNISSAIEKPDKRLNLKAQSNELKDIPIIVQLFKNQIPKEQILEGEKYENSRSFSTFYVYYQVIEILITVIFEHRFKQFVKEIEEDTEKLFDKRDELDGMVSEKRRVILLFENYTSIDTENKRMLNEQCIRLLELFGKKCAKGAAENLYAVRCLLVHKLYILTREGKDILNELNTYFLDVLMDMIMTFSK